MDGPKGNEEHPWDVSVAKPEKVDRAPFLRRNFSRDFISIEWGNWYRCSREDEPATACDIVVSLILFIAAASTLVWMIGFYHQTNVMDAHAHHPDGEIALNGKIDSPFQRSWTVFVGRRGMPSSKAQAAQIKAVHVLQEESFRRSCCDHGRKLLQYNPPLNVESTKSLDVSDLDTNDHDYPGPGHNPSPPHYGSIDYAPIGPHRSPDFHDYPPGSPTSFV